MPTQDLHRTAKLKADVPQLEAIISKTWGKEDELKQLKSELAALDHKITVELAPTHDENDGTENKQVQSQQPQTEIRTTNVEPDNSQNRKTSMVAEPESKYSPREPLNSRIIIGGCGAAPPGGFRARPKL